MRAKAVERKKMTCTCFIWIGIPHIIYIGTNTNIITIREMPFMEWWKGNNNRVITIITINIMYMTNPMIFPARLHTHTHINSHAHHFCLSTWWYDDTPRHHFIAVAISFFEQFFVMCKDEETKWKRAKTVLKLFECCFS